MVVASLRSLFPFVHCPASAVGLDAILSRQVLGKKAVLITMCSEKREAAPIAHVDREAGVDK